MYETIYGALAGTAAGMNVPQWTIETMREVAAGRSDVRAVRHPLGFVCLPLERAGERGVCVHVWSAQLRAGQATTSTVHAHSWDLVSYVLYGRLRNELVDVADDLEAPTHRLCEVSSDAAGDEIRRTGRLVRRGGSVSEVHQRGDVYGLPAGVFHETVPEGETATVALGSGRPGAVDLALGGLHTGTHRVRRQLCDRHETAHAATVVLERIGQVGQPRAEDPCGCTKR
ncbi:hypothetical protein [Amycolatopsis taiwanensis]|nr:hypothetical protein [Amycolatopsis taiwanensis]